MGMQTRCCAFDWKSCKRFKLFLMIYNEDTYTYVCAYNVNEFQNVYNSPARDDDFNGLLWKNKIKFFNLKNTTYLVFKRFECFNMFCEEQQAVMWWSLVKRFGPHGIRKTQFCVKKISVRSERSILGLYRHSAHPRHFTEHSAQKTSAMID